MMIQMDKEEARNILGVDEDDDENKIKKRRNELVKKNHPDQGGSEELFKRVEKAYEVVISGENSVNSGEKQKATRGNENNQTKSQYGDYEAHARQYTFPNERTPGLDTFFMLFPDKFFTRIFPISFVTMVSLAIYSNLSGMSSNTAVALNALVILLVTWKYNLDYFTLD
jgi:curved DNA-binding protein CbpA